MRKIRVKMVAGIIAVILLVFGILSLYFIFGKHISNIGSSDGSGASFHPNAWKFAELVQDGALYPVDHVVDGDTLVADVAGHYITLRLIGMDTPETVDPRKPVECYGPQASAEAKRIFGVYAT